MTARTSILLPSHDHDWEARWDEANERFQALSGAFGAAQAAGERADDFHRRLDLMRSAGADMQNAFLARFRTVDEYVNWRLYWLRGSLPQPFLQDIRIPADLTVLQVRARFEEAYPVLNRIIARGSDDRSDEDEAQVRSILSRPPSSGAPRHVALICEDATDHV